MDFEHSKRLIRSFRPLFHIILFTLIVGTTFTDAHAETGITEKPSQTTRIVFFIVDGMGFSHVDLTRVYLDRPLSFETLPIRGSVLTAAADKPITDSAAAATALAAGVKANVGMIGMTPQGQPLTTLLHAARYKGWATGLVTTTRITHATPAAFIAHVRDRAQEDVIAAQMIKSGADILFGGGYEIMTPLLASAEAEGYEIVRTREDLLRKQEDHEKILGLFASGHMAYELERDTTLEPSLSEMAIIALNRLDQNPNGFFVMIEAGRVDQASHDNITPLTIMDMVAFDETVSATLDWLGERNDVLIVITADHETGGLLIADAVNLELIRDPEELSSLPYRLLEQLTAPDHVDVEAVFAPYDVILEEGFPLVLRRRPTLPLIRRVLQQNVGVHWTTVGHTDQAVPLYALGPGADRFAGELDNTEVALRIAELGGLDISGLQLP